jgi:hypothetical protein
VIAGNPPQLERIKLALCKLVQDIKRDRPMRKKERSQFSLRNEKAIAVWFKT